MCVLPAYCKDIMYTHTGMETAWVNSSTFLIYPLRVTKVELTKEVKKNSVGQARSGDPHFFYFFCGIPFFSWGSVVMYRAVEGWAKEWVDAWRDRARGEYRFMKLMK